MGCRVTLVHHLFSPPNPAFGRSVTNDDIDAHCQCNCMPLKKSSSQMTKNRNNTHLETDRERLHPNIFFKAKITNEKRSTLLRA